MQNCKQFRVSKCQINRWLFWWLSVRLCQLESCRNAQQTTRQILSSMCKYQTSSLMWCMSVCGEVNPLRNFNRQTKTWQSMRIINEIRFSLFRRWQKQMCKLCVESICAATCMRGLCVLLMMIKEIFPKTLAGIDWHTLHKIQCTPPARKERRNDYIAFYRNVIGHLSISYEQPKRLFISTSNIAFASFEREV